MTPERYRTQTCRSAAPSLLKGTNKAPLMMGAEVGSSDRPVMPTFPFLLVYCFDTEPSSCFGVFSSPFYCYNTYSIALYVEVEF